MKYSSVASRRALNVLYPFITLLPIGTNVFFLINYSKHTYQTTPDNKILSFNQTKCCNMRNI